MVFGLAAPAAADYEAGVTAYRQGDYALALREWRPLAEAGEAGAQAGLANMYRAGLGVAQDSGEALKWYQKAVGQGHTLAQYNLGLIFANGRLVAKDLGEALRWYREAAN